MANWTLNITKQGRNYRISKTNDVGGASGGDTARNIVGALWIGFGHQADHCPITRVVVDGRDWSKSEVLALLGSTPSGALFAKDKAMAMMPD